MFHGLGDAVCNEVAFESDEIIKFAGYRTLRVGSGQPFRQLSLVDNVNCNLTDIVFCSTWVFVNLTSTVYSLHRLKFLDMLIV